MKKIFILSAITLASSLSADQYGRNSCSSGSCSSGNCEYDNAQNNRQYYQNSAPQYQAPQYQENRNRQTYQNQDTSNRNIGNQSDADLAISKKVNDILASGWVSKGFGNVTYSVSRGVVTLRGTASTIDDKNKIQDSIKKIDGVTQVDNQITISAQDTSSKDNASKMQYATANYPNDYAATDADKLLNGKIRDKLNNGWVSSGYQTLVIKTTNGVVIVSGVVDQLADSQKVEKQLKGIDGVKDVKNTLTVKNQ